MSRNVYIAGASSRARTTREYIEYLNPGWKVRAFLVSPEMTDNEDVVDGILVLPIKEDEDIDVNCEVYIGTRGINHDKLSEELVGIGFSPERIIPVSVDLDTRLRNEYVRKKYEEAGKDFVKFCDFTKGYDKDMSADTGVSACIYEASSVFDGKLSDAYEHLREEKRLQVGAALTDVRLPEAAAADNTGDNISIRNKQFCELTGLYWIWKNASEDIVGLVHYRRHFLLPDNWVRLFCKNGVDVILPVPLYVAPSVEENYRERHTSSDWDNMMNYLKENYPSDHKKAEAFFREGLYSPCNMLIARKEVLAELCEWFFPIVFAVADKGGEREDAYQNRYPGFISERLITYFFESRRDKYKVVYADKNFLS